jgi:PAS domain S-box-containing protein
VSTTAKTSKPKKPLSKTQNNIEELEELKAALNAIQNGEVDALFVSTPEGRKVYTLSSAEQPYRLLLEKMGQGALMLLPDGRIIFANEQFAKMWGLTLSDLNGKKIQDIFDRETEIDKLLQHLNLTKNPVNRTVPVFSKKGKPLVVYISLGILKMGKSMMNYLIMTDITKDEETKRLSTIGQTAGMVGHDIRNPLQAITGDLYLTMQDLKEMPNNAAKQSMQETLNNIQDNVFYINKIVSDLQDYTRPLKPFLEKVNVRDLINSTLILVNVPENITTEINSDQNLILKIDAAYIKRALTNLILNAIQAMPNGGKLTINATPMKDKATISVEDTGVGIPDSVKAKLFTPLFTTKSKGQGLGLAVVKRFVEGLNGKISFESMEDSGTKFIIEIPLMQELDKQNPTYA